MAQQTLENNVSFGVQRSRINDNFTELYRLIGRTVSAKHAGILSSNTGSQNTAALQALIDSLTAAGIAAIQFDEGIYLFDAQGSPSTRPGSTVSSKACIWMKSNIFLLGRGEGTVLKRNNNQQTDAVRVNLVQCNPNTNNFGFAKVRFVGNTANQPGYTGPYTGGDTAGALLALGDSSFGNPGLTGLRMDDIWLEDNFGVASDTLFAYKSVNRLVHVKDCGEGFQFVGGDSVLIEDYYYDNPGGVQVQDALETAATTNVTIRGFEIRNSAVGSALDLSGTGIVVSNGQIINADTGLTIQCEGANEVNSNSDHFLVSGVTARNVVSVAFQVGVGQNGNCRGTLSDCHAVAAEQGFGIGQQATRGIGNIQLLGCSSRGHSLAGLFVGTVNKLVVDGGCHFDDGLANAHGIQLRNNGATASDHQRVEIDNTTCNNNGLFGVYVEEGFTYKPQGFVRVHASGNQTSNSTYWGNQYVDSEMFLNANNVQNFELTNTRKIYRTALARPDLPITGEKLIVWNHGTLRQLNGLTHDHIFEILFGTDVMVEHRSTSAGNNISLYGEVDAEFAKNNSIRLKWDSVFQLAIELSRSVNVGTTPSAIATIPNFDCQWLPTAGLFTDAGSTAANSGDPVLQWRSTVGTERILAATGSGSRPTRDSLGGVYGGSGKWLQLESLNLNGPFTLLCKHRTPPGFAGSIPVLAVLDPGSGNSWAIGAYQAHRSYFYDNRDASVQNLGIGDDVDIVVGVGVASDGATTLFHSDGTTTSGEGSVAGSPRSATATLFTNDSSAGTGLGTLPVRSIALFNRVLSQAEFQAVQGYMA